MSRVDHICTMAMVPASAAAALFSKWAPNHIRPAHAVSMVYPASCSQQCLAIVQVGVLHGSVIDK